MSPVAKHTTQRHENHGQTMMEREKHTKKKRVLGPTINLKGKRGRQLHFIFSLALHIKGRLWNNINFNWF
jgi:hypothetical protein